MTKLLKISINEEQVKLQNVKPENLKEFLTDQNSPLSLKLFIESYTNNKGYVELSGLDDSDVKEAIKTLGGNHEA